MYKIADVVEWQTRQTQNLLVAISYGFESHHRHQTIMGGCMEYVNIISKTEITQAFQLPILIVGHLAIAAVLSTFIYWAIVKNIDKVARYLCTVAAAGLSLLMITAIICGIFFQVPTGRYRYEATVDKNKITVAQYEKFIEEYTPTIKDGIYYWED